MKIKNTNASACPEPPSGYQFIQGNCNELAIAIPDLESIDGYCHIAGRSVHALTAVTIAGLRLVCSCKKPTVRRDHKSQPYFIFCVETTFVYILALLSM
jgi:hypothetical protein